MIFDGLKGAVPLCTCERDGQAKSDYLGDIHGCFWAVRGPPGMTDRGFAPSEASWHRTNKKGLTFDGLKDTEPLFTCEKDGHAKSGLRDIFGASTGPRLG